MRGDDPLVLRKSSFLPSWQSTDRIERLCRRKTTAPSPQQHEVCAVPRIADYRSFEDQCEAHPQLTRGVSALRSALRRRPGLENT